MVDPKAFDLEADLLKDYDNQYDRNGISGERLAYRLGEISKIGLTNTGGSNRPGFSEAEKQAKTLISSWMKVAGLVVYEDGAGNVFGTLVGKNKALPAILSGSHVDSVPNGGHFDGPLGVLTALEVVEAWRAIGYQPEKPFEIVIFSDEEGTRFNNGLNGSEAMIGKAELDEKLHLKDTAGLSFEEVLKTVGLSKEGYANAGRDLAKIERYIEVHIEQGKRLESANLACGIVTGIAGPCWLEFIFCGEAGHAGNTPMNDRKDALVAASAFILAVNKLPSHISDSAVITVGKQEVEPNGVNVIPGKVTLYVDIRDIYEHTRDDLVEQVLDAGKRIASEYKLEVTHTEKIRVKPVLIEESTQELLAQVLDENDIKPYRLPSGAAHDAMILGEKLPVAMLFVRSKDGVSHNPAEWSDLNDCIQAAHILKAYVERIQI